MRSTIHLVSAARLLAARARGPRGAARVVAAGHATELGAARDGGRGARGCAPRSPAAPLRAQGDRRAGRQAAGARRRPLGRPRARAAVGHVGAPPRGPLRARRGLDRARRRSTRDGGRRAPRAPLPRRLRPGHAPRTSRTGRRPPAADDRAGARAARAAPLPRRGRRGAARPARARRCPTPTRRRPSRFLPTWDASLLVHARRTGVLPEEHRPRIFHTKTPQSFPTFLVDGAVAGTWRYEKGAIDAHAVRPPRRRDAPRARRRGRAARRVRLARTCADEPLVRSRAGGTFR